MCQSVPFRLSDSIWRGFFNSFSHFQDQAKLLVKMLVQVYTPISDVSRELSSYLPLALSDFQFLPLRRCKMSPHCGLLSVSLTVNEVECLWSASSKMIP